MDNSAVIKSKKHNKLYAKWFLKGKEKEVKKQKGSENNKGNGENFVLKMYRQIVKINDKNDMDSNLEINVEEFIDNNKKIGKNWKKKIEDI